MKRTKDFNIKPYFILAVAAVIIIDFTEWGRIYKIGSYEYAFIGLFATGMIIMALSKK